MRLLVAAARTLHGYPLVHHADGLVRHVLLPFLQDVPSLLGLSLLRRPAGPAAGHVGRWWNELCEGPTLQFAIVRRAEAFWIGFLDVDLVVRSPLKAEPLRVHELLVALRGHE